ncbi:hypothetical protein D6D08_09058 [Aureobasidium pullulans]|nr:hypothetical protein D6D08_09058 [Aureobasidium pullulans]
MFANFSSTSEGLVESKPRPKPNGLNLSCLPCRRKKKRCDAARPTCGRCRNSYGRDVCVWSDEKRNRGRQSREIKADQRHIQSDSSPSTTPQSSSWEVVKSDTSTNSITSPVADCPMDLRFHGFFPWTIPDAVTNISPDLSPQMFLNISTTFQRRILCLDIDFKDSIIMDSLPLALDHPPLLHAWVACSVIALSRSMPYWYEKAIKHYDSAVSGLSRALQAQNETGDKWKRETVILLHLFEGFQSRSDESALGKAHLRGAHELFNPRVKDKSPMSYHEALVLEGYIMHTTNNYLFQPDSQLPLDHITKAAETLVSALEQLGLSCNWRHSPWIGFGGPELADLVFRASWLAHKTSLNTDDRQQVENIITRLSSWTAPACFEESLTTHLDLPPKRLVLLAKAYWCACSYLITHLSHHDGNPVVSDDTAFVTETLELLDQLTEYEQTINNHLWPLIVVGTAATSLKSQEHIRSLLPQFNQALGPGSVKRAERFLEVAWRVDHNGEMYGRKIFKDRDALYQMFF